MEAIDIATGEFGPNRVQFNWDNRQACDGPAMRFGIPNQYQRLMLYACDPAHSMAYPLFAPRVQQPGPDAVPVRHGLNHRTRAERLTDNPQLLLYAPATAPLAACTVPRPGLQERSYAPRMSPRPFSKRPAASLAQAMSLTAPKP